MSRPVVIDSRLARQVEAALNALPAGSVAEVEIRLAAGGRVKLTPKADVVPCPPMTQTRAQWG